MENNEEAKEEEMTEKTKNIEEEMDQDGWTIEWKIGDG